MAHPYNYDQVNLKQAPNYRCVYQSNHKNNNKIHSYRTNINYIAYTLATLNFHKVSFGFLTIFFANVLWKLVALCICFG